MTNQRLTKDRVETTKKGLFWFRYDLRLHDQPALDALRKQVDEISFVYILDIDQINVLSTDSGHSYYQPDSFRRGNKGLQTKSDTPNIGKHRYRFLLETLADLNHQLRALGHSLIVLNGNTLSCLELLLTQNGYTHLGVSQHNGFYEIRALDDIQKRFANVELIKRESFSLFNECDLPFNLENMPQVFSPFRRKVEKVLAARPTHPKIESLPTSFLPQLEDLPAHISLFDISCYAPKCDEGEFVEGKYVKGKNVEGEFIGGESAGLRHLETYLFEWNAASTYKETRNTLDVWPDSTKLSAWLANGALSARYVMQRLKHYEETIEKNESTYWIYFELLWREFFYWLQKCHGSNWFRFSGIKGVSPDTTHNTDVFKDWCNGNTGYPIVDACMRQLLATGYMSNRGRQLVASCFVHELRQDWRYGSAWFEQQLIDYDVGSNWGNWLYLAGVGSDPRGHRQFNLQKQTETYDPDGTFRNKWLP